MFLSLKCEKCNRNDEKPMTLICGRKTVPILYKIYSPKIGMKCTTIPQKKFTANLFQRFIIYINKHYPWYDYLIKGGAKTLAY